MIEINWEPHTRLELLQKIIDTNGYKSYLEIGCDRDQVFGNIEVQTKVGVDPKRGGTVRMTSDEFFKKTCCTKYDLIFIDGLHTYEQVKTDFDNAWTRLAPNGTVVIHDMLPTAAGQATPEPTEKAWLGDVWKFGFDLLERGHIKFNLMTMDYGCGIATPNIQSPQRIEGERDWAFYEQHYTRLPLTTWEEYFGA